jgi:Tol biopolymer transport system component
MSLPAGHKLGPYEIIELIGKGGMGEVYRARDPRLNRDVAIKVSAAQFSERFEREARAVAALNHPNICTLYDVGPNYLVMELVEGEAPQGPMPLEEALRIARQIAAALEEAHEKGVTHRDLKPGNIKAKPDGTVKVLDFGLAKFSPAEPGATPTENSPTLSMAATQAGVILGTAGYMSPEQARGKPADKRADIWAFGVVLYEMLTGKRLFKGEDVSQTLAAVIMEKPDLKDVPVQVRKLLRRCLEKEPKNRLRDIGDVWQLLDEGGTPPSGRSVAQRHWLMWGVATPFLLAATAALVWIYKPSPALAITRFPISLGEGQSFSNLGRRYLAISPDGTQMVYVANQRLYLRSMAEPTPRAIPGTDLPNGMTNPVFSPDGKSLAFFASGDGTLKRIAVTGGPPVTLCPAPTNPLGVSWSQEGILFQQLGKGILRVSPDGGQPDLLVTAKNDEVLEGAQMLPGGQAILYASVEGNNISIADWDRAQIVVQTLKSGERKTLISGGSDPYYLPTGHLVYVAGGILFAVPFDLRRLEKTGGPVGIVEGVARSSNGPMQAAFSDTGSLMYVPGPVAGSGPGQDSLALVDSKGMIQPVSLPPAAYGFPRVSRDGKRLVYQIEGGKESSVWIYELSGTAAPRRLTLPGMGANRYPIWSANGERVAFQSDREGDAGIWWQRADGNGAAERLTKPEKGVSQIPDSWSPDDQTLSFTEIKTGSSAVWTYSLRDKKPTLFVESAKPFLGRSVFSPDGRWLAYQDSNVEDNQIYVQPFPLTAAKYQVPHDGTSHHPVWSRDGKTLFFVAGNGAFDSVSVTTQPSLTFGTPVRAPRAGFSTQQGNSVRNYDVVDGRHFIGTILAGQAQAIPGGAPQIQVVLNWFEDVKQRASGK